MTLRGETLFVRRDDPMEKVRILSQERSPDGKITFEVVEPEHFAGVRANLQASRFHLLYEDPTEVTETAEDPPRPTSLGTMDQWRRYALWLEKKQRPRPPVYRSPGTLTVPGRTISSVDAAKEAAGGLRNQVLEPDSDDRPLGRGF